MKKKVIYFIVIVLLSFFATSCCRQKNIEIKDKDKLRFNENDMFIYKSNLGNYDTLFFEEIKSEFKYRNTSEGFCGNKVYKEQLIYFYQNYTEPFPEDSLLYLSISYDKYNDDLYFRLGYRGVSSYTGDFHFGGGTLINKYFLGDSLYNNVRSYTISTNKTNDKPYKLFFNRQYGILSYEYRTGEIYKLLKYIPENN